MNATAETELVTLPAVAPTGFPVSYEEARAAIARCESPLECRTMADQAAAMAIYARMRDDTDLQNRATRLQAWAARRWGEIDRELNPDRRQDNLKQNSQISAAPPNCHQQQFGKRTPSADGTTDRQRVISRRLAAIPEPEFSRQVESPNPPSITALAEAGKAATGPRNTTPWAAIECTDVRVACETLERFVAFCDRCTPEGIPKAIGAAEADELRRLVATAGRWLKLLNDSLSAGD